MCPRRSGENRQGQRLRYRSRRPTLRRTSTPNKASIFGDSNCDADHFQAALCWPGADLPPEGVHCKGAELLVATRRHRRRMARTTGRAVGPRRDRFCEDFAKLSQGQHPQTGEQLVRQRASYEYQDADGKTVKTMEHRAGWDATFSTPKSVSLTALVGRVSVSAKRTERAFALPRPA